MKRFVDDRKLDALIPSWAGVYPDKLARAIEKIILDFPKETGVDISDLFKHSAILERTLPFCISVDAKIGKVTIISKNDENRSHIIGNLFIDNLINPFGGKSQLIVQLNEIFIGCPSAYGEHTLYAHTVSSETPLSYVGVTKQKWYARFSQHISDAKSGSGLVFHRALMAHSQKDMQHRIIVTGVDFNNAMKSEEKFVEKTLYPIGLNMIPGGFAGLRYLHKLGIKANSVKQRDRAIARLLTQENIDGKPNPLCAARWKSDQDFINRVICGHGDRLTVEQVRQARLLGDFGLPAFDISEKIKAKNERQISNLLSGKHYARIA